MYCHQCGTKIIIEESNFCFSCGTKLNKELEPTEKTPIDIVSNNTFPQPTATQCCPHLFVSNNDQVSLMCSSKKKGTYDVEMKGSKLFKKIDQIETLPRCANDYKNCVYYEKYQSSMTPKSINLDSSPFYVYLEYIGGCPHIKSAIVSIRKEEPGVLIINGVNFDLLSVDWQEQGTRSVGKAAFGAILGDIIAGPIGSVAGAAIGGSRKDNSTLVLGLNYMGASYTTYFRCTKEEFRNISILL